MSQICQIWHICKYMYNYVGPLALALSSNQTNTTVKILFLRKNYERSFRIFFVKIRFFREESVWWDKRTKCFWIYIKRYTPTVNIQPLWQSFWFSCESIFDTPSVTHVECIVWTAGTKAIGGNLFIEALGVSTVLY